MKTKILHCIISITIILTALSFISCGKKKTDEEKGYEKAQKIYNEKGIKKFIEYVEKEKYYPIKVSERNDGTPLLAVVEDKNIEAAKLFLEKGASYDEKDIDGNDLINYALKSGNSDTIDFAISVMPSVYWNTKNSDSLIPLIKIIESCSDFNCIKNAYNLNQDTNYIDKNNKSLLMYAAQCNVDVRTVKYLLDNGAEINTRNNNEWTAVMYAARYNPNPAIMEDLILRGAETGPNSVGLTLTMLASCNPNPGVLLTLLKYKNEINNSTDRGKTALMYACENGQNSSVIKMLIDNGADLNAKDLSGKTVREYLSANPSLSTSDIAIAWKSAEETVNTETAKIESPAEEIVEMDNIVTDEKSLQTEESDNIGTTEFAENEKTEAEEKEELMEE